MTARILTIGFAQKPAASFFTTLKDARIHRLVDIRLNNTSQLAGFTKRDDLAYFVREIIGIDYIHIPELAPSRSILEDYRSDGDWSRYEKDFLTHLDQRWAEGRFDSARALFTEACLLCSEPTPEHCHRRLVAEHIAAVWPDFRVVHL